MHASLFANTTYKHTNTHEVCIARVWQRHHTSVTSHLTSDLSHPIRLVTYESSLTHHNSHMNESCALSHVNESWLTYEWVMTHIWMSHDSSVIPHINKVTWWVTWLVTYECTMPPIWMSHVTFHIPSDSSRRVTYEWVMTHIRMSHDSHKNESHDMCLIRMSHDSSSNWSHALRLVSGAAACAERHQTCPILHTHTLTHTLATLSD